jgi:uncharacterized glyoxalase superfamily protein PhnB
MADPGSSPARIVPAMRYRDAPEAIDWLCRAFGFARHLVVPGPQGRIDHAQLTCGNAMIMLGSYGEETEHDRLIRLPGQIGGRVTQTIYMIVDDPDAHQARAKAAGAEIVNPCADQDYGGRVYTARDLEGHVWSFGSYDPWK